MKLLKRFMAYYKPHKLIFALDMGASLLVSVIGIGSAIPLKRRETVMVRGRDLITGLPHMIEISNEEITEALKEPLTTIMNNLRTCLENTPPELASDVAENGICITGGRLPGKAIGRT